jgi:predicted PurR-regulated permease PerM
MKKNAQQIILFTAVIIVGTYFLILSIIKAKAFLVPFTLAILLSMILLPIDLKLRSWGLGKALSIIIADLLLLGFCLGLFFIVALQVQNVVGKWPEYQEKLEPRIEQLQTYIEENTGVSKQEQDKRIREALQGQEGMDAARLVAGTVPGVIFAAGNFLLVFVYIFFIMYYRHRFKKSILNFFPGEKKAKASETVNNFSRISQQYLFGRFILIVFLVVVYSIGLLIVGVPHAILISILAAILSIIPYFGNIIGFFIALSLSLLDGGSLGEMIGILATFTIAQFIESNILEPYIVGKKVDINPPMTLFGVVIGGMIWGIAGMIIAIPVMGMMKVLFDNVPVLNPLGYVLDEGDEGSGEGPLSRLKNKITGLFKK